jgi:glycine/D-amino acid oxidase-like deaminating enzyme
MIANETPASADCLWTATARPGPSWPAFAGSAEAEVAIVGGGYSGLSAALHLAERGRSVILLEAETPGWGASGRNGGQVIAGLKEDPDEVERIFGPGMGRRVNALAAGAPDMVFALIERFAIACDAAAAGWLQPAADLASLELLRARVAQWQRRGAPVELLDRAVTETKLGSRFYLGALRDARGGTVQPLDYAQGLARAATSRGARIVAHARVIDLEPAPTGWRLTTRHGQVQAGSVLLATNGYTDRLWPGLARTVVPVRSVQVATAPLGDTLRRRILPDGEAASDARRLLVYFRLDAQGRLVIGGRGAYHERGARAAQARLRRAALTIFPDLGAPHWEHAWGGFVALTEDHLPQLCEPAPGLLTLLGYNGRGIAMATALGRVVADHLTGTPAAELDFPLSRLREMPLHALRRPLVGALTAWAGLRDRLGV